MFKCSTVGQRLSPARSKKNQSRRKSRRSRHREKSEADQNCFAITLRDVGDIDDRDLNTIPSSVEGETSSWGDKIVDKSNSLSTYTNPELQIQNYCVGCSNTLLDIHENNVVGANDMCDLEVSKYDVRRETVAQSYMEVFQNITEGRFDESKIEIVQSKSSDENGHEDDIIRKMEKKSQAISMAKKTSSKEVRCSLSTVNIKVMCTSESTLSTRISPEPTEMALEQPETAPQPKPMISKKNLETVAEALLVELCRATAGKIKIPGVNQEKMVLAKNSYLPRIKYARHERAYNGVSSLDASWSDWLQELCKKDPRKPRRGILKKTRSHVLKSKINIFRPLLCTKLSLPWFLPKSMPQITREDHYEYDTFKHKSSSHMKHVKPHHRNNTVRERNKEYNSQETARRHCNFPSVEHRIVHAYNSRKVNYRVSDSVLPFKEPAPPLDVPLRLFASKVVRKTKPKRKKLTKVIEESTEDSNNTHKNTGDDKKQIKGICPKCKSSMQCSSSMKFNPPKLRVTKTRGHDVLAYPCRKMVKKNKPTSRLEKRRRQKHDKLRESGKTRQDNGEPTTKYFIKSFFAGTTSTSETTKSPLKNTKKPGRHKKTYASPRMSARRTVEDRPRTSARSSRKRAEKITKKDESQSDIELEIIASKEMNIINEHIRSHRTASGSSPVFHTCFKHLVDKELNAQNGRNNKTFKSKKTSKCAHLWGKPHVEIKKFNEGIFSCLIPKVFK